MDGETSKGIFEAPLENPVPSGVLWHNKVRRGCSERTKIFQVFAAVSGILVSKPKSYLVANIRCF
jgi:hypothetical protein